MSVEANIEANLEIAVGGVQSYGLGGVCKDDIMRGCEGASRTMAWATVCCRQAGRAGANKSG